MPLLAIAAMCGNYRVVDGLLRRRADVNLCSSGNSILHFGAFSKSEEVVQRLLQAHANTSVTNAGSPLCVTKKIALNCSDDLFVHHSWRHGAR